MINNKVTVLDQLLSELCGLSIRCNHLSIDRRRLAKHQRHVRFVNKYTIDFIDDNEVMTPLDQTDLL